MAQLAQLAQLALYPSDMLAAVDTVPQCVVRRPHPYLASLDRFRHD